VKIKPNIHEIDEALHTTLLEIPEIHKIIAQLEVLILQNTKRFQSSLLSSDEKVGSDLFAPCIKVILHRATQGDNLNHNERLAIAFYFLNTNHTIEETVDIFRTSPDFDEGIARYQVEFVAGKGGKGTKYKMYNCKKMKSLHMCYADHPDFGDVLCVKGSKKRNGDHVTIQNPASDYIFWKKVVVSRHEREQKYLAEQERRKKTAQDATSSTQKSGPHSSPKLSSPSSSDKKLEAKPR
jgi:DNA primase large subunit